MTQYKNILGHKDKAIHMAQLKTEHLSGLEYVKVKVYLAGGGNTIVKVKLCSAEDRPSSWS